MSFGRGVGGQGCCGGSGRSAGIRAGEDRGGYIEECIGRDGVARGAGTFENPCARFVDGVVLDGIARSAGRAGIVGMNTGLGAAVDDIRFGGVVAAAEVDGVKILRSADVVGSDRGAVGRSVGGIAGNGNGGLGGLDNVVRCGHVLRGVDENAGSLSTGPAVNIVGNAVVLDISGSAKPI